MATCIETYIARKSSRVSPPSLEGGRALIFDLMGTCTDWHSSVLLELRSAPPCPQLPDCILPVLASDWRAGFFQEIHRRYTAGEPQEDTDTTHRRILDRLLSERGVTLIEWNDAVRHTLVQSWHHQKPWPDAVGGIETLKTKYFVIVLANGTTRLQLDVVKSAGLAFDTLLSSQLLAMTKPDPAMYVKAAELLGLCPEECIMVAAHAYDLRAAAKVGIKTVYIQRATEDPEEDMEKVRAEVDLFIDGSGGSEACGLERLADQLNIYKHQESS